jgi:protease II
MIPRFIFRLRTRAAVSSSALAEGRVVKPPGLQLASAIASHARSTSTSSANLQFFEEIRAHSTISLVGDTSEIHGPYRYWSYIPHGKTQPVYYRRTLAGGDSAPEEVVLDLNAASKELGSSAGLSVMRLSPDQSKLLYVLNVDGSDRGTLFMRDLTEKKESTALKKQHRKTRVQARAERAARPLLDSPFAIEGVTTAVWLPDGSAFLYCGLDDKNRANCVKLRKLQPEEGSADNGQEDLLLFEEPAEDSYCDLTTSKDHSFITINVNSRDKSKVLIFQKQKGEEYRLIEIPPDAFKREAEDEEDGHQYFLTGGKGILFAVTNIGHAPNYRLLAAPLRKVLDGARPAMTREGESRVVRRYVAAVDANCWAEIVPNRGSSETDEDGNADESDAIATVIDDIELCGYQHDDKGKKKRKGWIVVFESRNDRPQVLVIPFPTLKEVEAAAATSRPLWDPITRSPNGSYYLPLPEEQVVELSGGANADPSSQLFHFTASSAVSPPVEYCWDFEKQARKEMARRVPLSSSSPLSRLTASQIRALPPFAPQDLTSYRLLAPSWDGVNVPITLTHRKDILGTGGSSSDFYEDLVKSAEKNIDRTRELSERVAECNENWRRRTRSRRTATTPVVSPVAQILAACVDGWDDWRVEEPLQEEEQQLGTDASAALEYYPLANGSFPRSRADVLPEAVRRREASVFPPLERLQRAIINYSSNQEEYDERFLCEREAATTAGSNATTFRIVDEICSLSTAESKRLQWQFNKRMCMYGLESYWREIAVALGIRNPQPFPDSSYSPSYHRYEMLESPAAATSTLQLPPPKDYRHNNPLLFHCYGAYGLSLPIGHDPSKLPLLQRGWVMAYAHVRGGGELGVKSWYHQGRGFLKHNSFHDSLGAARALIAYGYTRSNYMACSTESAGSVVGGYLANNFPHLFKAHHMRVPFVDVLGAMSDPSLPLTQPEYLEWGKPRESTSGNGSDDDDPVLSYIRRYSPLQNVPSPPNGRDLRTPSFVAVTAENDERVNNETTVQFIRKWADYGKVPLVPRDHCTSNDRSEDGGSDSVAKAPFCLVINREGGHEGPSESEGRMKASAEICGLFYKALSLDPR